MIFNISTCLFLVLLICLTSAQEELLTFDDIRDFVENEQGVVSAVIHLPHCESDTDLGDSHLHIIEQFTEWLYFDYGNGTEKFRTTKYLLNPDGEWIFAIIEAFESGETKVFIQELTPTLEEIASYHFNCPIGNGTYFFAFGKGRPTVALDSYDDLKAALIEGKHVFLQSEVSACIGEDLGFAKLINARSPVDLWEINNEGSEDEMLWMTYDFWVDYYISTSLVGVEKISVGIYPNGSVHYVPVILDLISWEDGFTSPDVGFQCELGSSVRAVTPEREQPKVMYETFEELHQGLMADHEIEVMVDAKYCEWDSPDGPYYPTIFTITFPFWLLQNDPDSGKLIQFFHSMVAKDPADGAGVGLQQQLTVAEDNTVTVVLSKISPLTGTVHKDTALCPMAGLGAIFRSVSREREVLETIDDIHAAAFAGQKIGWQASIENCAVGPDWPVVFGGTFADGFTFDPHELNGTFYGPVTELLNIDGDLFAWGSLALYWLGDTNTTVITAVQHSTIDWEDLLQGQGYWECEMGTGDVYFYH